MATPRIAFAEDYNNHCLPAEHTSAPLTSAAEPGQILLEADEVINEAYHRIWQCGSLYG